jgi:hypothetical protein
MKLPDNCPIAKLPPRQLTAAERERPAISSARTSPYVGLGRPITRFTASSGVAALTVMRLSISHVNTRQLHYAGNEHSRLRLLP